LSAGSPVQSLSPSTINHQQQDNGVWLIVIVFGYIFGLFLIFVIIWFIWYGTSLKRGAQFNRQLKLGTVGTLNSGQTASTHHFYDYSAQSSLNRPQTTKAITNTHQQIVTAAVNQSPSCSYSPAICGSGGRTNASYREETTTAAALYCTATTQHVPAHNNHHQNNHHPQNHHNHLHHHHNQQHHHHNNNNNHPVQHNQQQQQQYQQHQLMHNSSSGSSNLQHSSSNNNNQDDLTSSHSTSFIHSYQHRI
jgi:hypothetical protein